MKVYFARAILILIVIVFFSLIHLFFYTQNMKLKYKISEIKVELNEVLSKNRQLGSQVAAKENLARIEETARKKLGMIFPKEVNYIFVTGEAR